MNITDLLCELQIEYRGYGDHHHTTPNHVSIDCPFCSPGSGRFRLGIHIEKHYASCWHCGAHPLGKALQEASGLSYQKVKALSTGLVRSWSPEPALRGKGRLVRPVGVESLQEPHRRYLRGRGIDPTQAEHLWRVQGIGHQSELAWRLYLPLILNGREIAWTTRSILPGGSRYWSSKPEQEEVPIKSCVFGIDLVKTSAVIVEGPMDAMKIGPGAVATMGTSYTRAQVLQLSRIPNRVICFDQGDNAQSQARRLARELSAYPGITRVVELDSKDPGEATEEELEFLREML